MREKVEIFKDFDKVWDKAGGDPAAKEIRERLFLEILLDIRDTLDTIRQAV